MARRVPWTDQELEVSVRAYVRMLDAEAAGTSYSKADVRRETLKLLDDRSEGSFEYRMQNISAVLQDMGLPFIDGYKPAGHGGTRLQQVVAQRMAWRPPAAMGRGMATTLTYGPTPPPRSPSATTPERRAVRIDFAEREQQNRMVGKVAERLVFDAEQARLRSVGRDDLADQVEWVAETEGDGLGYDIRSFDLDGNHLFIEVKGTKAGPETPFYLSANELTVATEAPERYQLHRVYSLNGTAPSCFVVRGHDVLSLRREPVAFRVFPGS